MEDLPQDFKSTLSKYFKEEKFYREEPDKLKESSPFKQERSQIIKALQETNWNRTSAAKKLGISRMTLYRKMKNYLLSPEE